LIIIPATKTQTALADRNGGGAYQYSALRARLPLTGTKPRLPWIEDISEAKRNMKTTHVALDAV
jgi:hypothetical protein